jgi:hypothetical protein
MKRQRHRIQTACLGALALALAGSWLAVPGCSTSTRNEPVRLAVTGDGTTTPISQLPSVDGATSGQLLGQLLPRPSALGETSGVQLRLPPPHNRALTSSLVRIIGENDSPHVLVSSDALARLGVLGRSPGADYFTAFATLAPSELDRLKRDSDQIASGAFGRPTTETVLFSGRTAAARASFSPVNPSQFAAGVATAVNRCSILPSSTLQAWGQSLFITSSQVVLDPSRTWDPCTGAGVQGGVWTFAHLVREMANGSGKTPEDFVKDWLSLWLNDYTANGDPVAARTQMFDQVILPWATASGVTATLGTTNGGARVVNLSGPLNLNIAPYRLLAIVNRIDLGTTTNGTNTIGTTTAKPETAGELRFIFGVVQPSPWGAGTEATCGLKKFTTIFEYGVPGTGCTAAVNWAKQWTALQAAPGFTSAYLAQLQSMTESVVLHGAAPAKGNQNALDQIRTNEIALGNQWELREFTLSDEMPAAGTDLPSNGELRTHTVAQTPNAASFDPLGNNPNTNAFVNGPVASGLELPVSLPNHCDASYTLPYFVGGSMFRGGHALVQPPDFWLASGASLTPVVVCARHQFSMNTCSGCHHGDTGTNTLGGSTNFVHADPMTSIPVTLSKFLTGGGSGMTFNVADTQFSGSVPLWQFADLHRRLGRLFELASCTSCVTIIPLTPKLIDVLSTIGPIPEDIDPSTRPDLKIGPITDLATVQKVLNVRASVAGSPRSDLVDVYRTVENLSH